MNLSKSQKLSMGISIALFIVLLGLLNLVTPFLFKAFPNDYVRTRVMLNYLKKDQTPEPKGFVFGSSISMSGIDANCIQKNLNDHLEILHFGSSGQPLQESALYYSQLPKSTKIVIQTLSLVEFSKKMQFSENIVVGLSLSGYRVDETIKKILPDDVWKTMDVSPIKANFKGRVSVRSGLQVWIRAKLDDDAPGANLLSLKYPYNYPSNREQKNYDRDLKTQNLFNKFKNFSVDEEYLETLKRAKRYFESRGIAYFIILNPESSDITSATKEEKENARKLVREAMKDFNYFDCFDYLEVSEFYDPVHPNRIGGEKWSKHIAEWINGSFKKQD